MTMLSLESKYRQSPFSWKGMKANKGVYPVYFCVGLGVIMAIAYPLRMALLSPDVSWNQKKNPEPWQVYSNKEYKFFQMEKFDTPNYIHPRPKI